MKTTKLSIKIIVNILIILLFTATTFYGQNLVPNGSFEQSYGCPQYLRTTDKNIKLVPGWNWPTQDGTADYFHSCSTNGMTGVPKNNMGEAPTKEGNGYIGLILKSHGDGKANYREYVEAKLTQTMQKDKIYCVSLHYRLANCATFSINRLGICFTEQEINIVSDKNLGSLVPQIEAPTNQYLDNNREWKPLYTIYKATGNENFMVIGNFKNDTETDEKQRKQPSGCDARKDYAYYYIDSVQVIELKNNCEPCVCVPQDLEMTISQAECWNGGTDLTAEITGGTIPYRKFKWADGTDNTKYKHALTGTHTATVSDDWGCKTEASVSFDCGKPLSAKITKYGYDGGNSGFINLEIYDGKPPYRVAWSNGDTTQNISGLTFGTYNYTVTDAQNASCKGDVTFTPPLDVSHQAHYTQGTDGFINLTVSGGVKPYQFEWSTGAITQNVKDLPAGVYNYKVTDAEGRTKTDVIIFTPPLEVAVDQAYTDGTDGHIYLTPKGGKGPYKYKWANGDTTSNLDNLPAGVYAYTVADAEGRVAQGTIRFVEPLKVKHTSGYTFENDGFINLDIAGGCPPYKIAWEHGATEQNLTYLENGLYRYTVTCACGKVASDTVRIKGSIVLNSVLFKVGSAELLPESFPELDRVASYMLRRSKIKVEIAGHTDNQGSDVSNQKLSENRAKSVVTYLITKGIETERLIYTGYGEAKPKTTNDTPEGRAINRRVEMNILDQ